MSHTLDTTGYRRHSFKSSADDAIVAVTTTIPPNMILTEGMRGIRLMIIGGADTNTGTVLLNIVERNYVQGPGGVTHPREIVYISRLGFTITFVISLLAGVDSVPLLVSANELFADEYVLTVETYGQRVLANANGSADVYSNTGALAGEIFISDLGNAYGIQVIHSVISAGTQGTIFRLDT